MEIQLFFLCSLTFVIHLIGTLAYSVGDFRWLLLTATLATIVAAWQALCWRRRCWCRQPG